MVKPSETRPVVVAWVRRTTKAQGLPAKVSDPEAIEGVVSLLKDGRQARRVRAARKG